MVDVQTSKGSALYGAIGYLSSVHSSQVQITMDGPSSIRLFLLNDMFQEFSDADVAFMQTLGFDYDPNNDYSYFTLVL